MSLIASMVKFASKLHPRAKKTWAEFSVPQMCKYVAAWSLKRTVLYEGRVFKRSLLTVPYDLKQGRYDNIRYVIQKAVWSPNLAQN